MFRYPACRSDFFVSDHGEEVRMVQPVAHSVI